MVSQVYVMEKNPVTQCGDLESTEQKDPDGFAQLKIKHGFTIEASRVITYGRNQDGLRLVEKAFVPPLPTIGPVPHCVSLRSTTILNTL